MYSLSKGPISPKGFPEVNFSFAETSFEKVYERLQKDIKIVESQDENDFIANTSSVDTFYSETNNSKQQFDGSRNQVQLIRESDGTFRTITGEKVVLLDHLGHKVQLIPVSGDSNTSSTFSIKALSVSIDSHQISYFCTICKFLQPRCGFRMRIVQRMNSVILKLTNSKKETGVRMALFTIFPMKFR